MAEADSAPLSGFRVIVRASGVAAAYAARLLGAMGAQTVFVEPPEGSPLRREPPFLDSGQDAGEAVSALFAYLAAGARSAVCDLSGEDGRRTLAALLEEADVFIDDTPLAERARLGLDQAQVAGRHPELVHVSVLPFGAAGPKAGWAAEEINLLHAAGEGNLLPNGLSVETFPDRPPVKIYGHFIEQQGGVAAALGALSALWARPEVGGQFVDIASQDAGLAVSAFGIQRYGDGSIEHRRTRSFRYGGVLECVDGYVELLTLEQHQWHGLVEVMGRPDWATDPALEDSLERSRRGDEINRHIRAWAKGQRVADLVASGQAVGTPLAKYNDPADVLADAHERARGLFAPVEIPGIGALEMLGAPVRFDDGPLTLRGGPPVLGEFQPPTAAGRAAAAGGR
jgi:crotonobetainyl-CoA:carnitine CoA-transferase CaiB-like acyl-CoA transferase